jgi:hypothetical protein
MSNDECPKNAECPVTKANRGRVQLFVIPDSSFFRDSSSGIRHSASAAGGERTKKEGEAFAAPSLYRERPEVRPA